MSGPGKPSGIRPPTSRLVQPSVSVRPSSNGSSGESLGRRPSEDLARKKTSVDRSVALDDDRDEVSDLPSLPGSRKTSEQMRRLSDGSVQDAAAYELARRLSEAGIRRMSEANIVLTTDTDSFIIGQRVYVNGIKSGVIQFIGETKFAPGDWAGIVLDDLSGKNDGSVGGVRYFQCQPKKGVFSRLTRLTRQPLEPGQLAALQTAGSSENGDAESVGSASRHTSPPPVGAPASSIPTGGPTPTTHTVVSVQSIGDLRLGDRVIVTSSQGSKAGTLRYLGNAEFAAGQWAGVELDDPLGKNDGAVAGTRYFDCPPHYGLFAPIHKVSRSPANQMRRPSSSAMNASMSRAGLSRQGTRDSLGDRASQAGSVASSRASTAVSRVSMSRPSAIGSPRLGVTSLTSNNMTSPTHQTLSSRLQQKGSRPSIGGTHGNLQDLLREKDQHIEQLMKEREMERSEVTRAAAQADEAEHQLGLLQRRFNEEQESLKSRMAELEELLQVAETSRATQAAQIDDLQFRLEEETIMRSDLESQSKGFEEKEKELARQIEQLEKEAQRSFEAEELAARYKDELDALSASKVASTEEPESSKDAETIAKLQSSILELTKSLKEEKEKAQSTSTEEPESSKDAETIAKLQSSILELTKSLEEEKEKAQSFKTELETVRLSLDQIKEVSTQDLKAKADDLERRELEFKEQLNQLKEEKIRLESDLKERTGHADEWKTKTDEQDRKVADMAQELAKISEEKVRLESELNDTKQRMEGEMNELNSKCEQSNRLVTESKEQLAKLENELLEARTGSALTSESDKKLVEEWRSKCQDLERREAEAKAKISQIEAELLSSKAELSSSEEAGRKLAEEWKGKCEELERRAEDTRTQLDRVENELKEAHDGLVRSKEIEKEWEVKYQDSESRLEESKALLSKLEAELVHEKDSLAKAVEIAKSDESVRQELVAKCSSLESQITDSLEQKSKLESSLTNVTQEAENMKSKVEDLERQLSNSEQKSSQLSNEKSRLESELLHLSSSSNDASQDLTRLHGELMAARQSLSDAETQLGTIQQEKSGLEQLVASLRSEMADKDQQSTEKISELERQLEEVKKKTEEAEKLNAQQLATLQEQESRLTSTKQDHDRLLEQLETLENKLKESTNSVDELQKSLAVLEADKMTWIEDKARLEELAKAIGSQLSNFKASREESLNTIEELQKSLAAMEAEKSQWVDEKFQLEESIAELEHRESILKTEQESSVNRLAELNETLANFETEKYAWTEEKIQMGETIQTLENQLSSLSSNRDEILQSVDEREKKLIQLTNEVERLRTGFLAHKAELDTKLNEHRQAAEVEQELRQALDEARFKADQLQSALNESRNSQQEIQEGRQQMETSLRADLNVLKQSLESLAAEKNAVKEREKKLDEELKAMKIQMAEQSARLQGQLQETRQEADSVNQLLLDLDEARKKILDLQVTVESAEAGRQAANDEIQLSTEQISVLEQEVRQLKDNLQLKESELKEEMDDRDKAEDRVLKLTEGLVAKEKELDALRHELSEVKKSNGDVSRLLTAFSTVDREKKALEAKVVELQVAAARNNSAAEISKDPDSREQKLKEDLENSRREIDFLNSVIVDMQRKCDELRMQLEISKATLLGQNVVGDSPQNGVKTTAPRLFCDICDQFDLHDTEDCPTQASSETDSPPALLNRSSAAYNQHSHHGGVRGSTRPYCDNCEVFGHLTSECEEEATY